ncbi:MAG TPA: MBL fold metallo-hydrolase [Steroidobacteraceae bacterium]|nr:MBL fold metallo-hydrolase [Steroidobacteraceae bacterium]
MDSQTRPGGALPQRRWRLRDVWRSLNGGDGHQGPRSDHFDGTRFFNPDAPAGRSFGDFLRWQRTRQRKVWPQWVENRARPELPAHLRAGEMALTFINHITFLIQFAGLNVLTDPVYSHRVSPFRSLGPARVRDPGLPFTDLPEVHVVLVSHNHYDHLDIETLIRLEEVHAPHFVTTLGNRAFLQQFGLSQVSELDWWQSLALGSAQVTLTPAQHWSARRSRNRNRTLWGGFMLRASGRQVFFAGDTGYGAHFSRIRERFGPADLALLPIGAYEPRWFMQNQHMNPDDAVRAHLDLKAGLSIGTHFGCFQLTDEGIDDPPRELAVAREHHGVPPEAFQVLETGETRIL